MGRFHSGKAAGLSDGFLLIIWREVVKLTTGEGLASDVLILREDANTTADGHGCAFVVTWGDRNSDFIISVASFLGFLYAENIICVLTSDHDDTDASGPAQLDGTHDFFTRRVEHANTAHKGQVSLEKKGKKQSLASFGASKMFKVIQVVLKLSNYKYNVQTRVLVIYTATREIL